MKSFFVIVLALSAVTAENSCTPGAFFKAGCKACICSSNGKSAVCAEMACPPEENANINDIDTVQTEHKQVCKPRSQFNHYCNVCSCSKDGSNFTCTKKHCRKRIWNKDGSRITKNFINRIKTQICTPNSHFKQDCNTCICSNNGLFMQCSMMICGNRNNLEEDIAQNQKQICEPNSRFQEDCNDCFCSSDGLYKRCTEEECVHDTFDEKKICEPNSSFKEDCNTCTCSEDGTFKGCTDMYCESNMEKSGKSVEKQVCEPNSSFKEDCNACTCSDDGTFKRCTDMYCESSTEEKFIESEIDKSLV